MPVCSHNAIKSSKAKFSAEKDSETMLRGYWPIAANGSILITSRQYYNFMKDNKRKGTTVKPFNDRESWDFLVHLMGDKWSEALRAGRIRPPDVAAAKSWAEALGGLRMRSIICNIYSNSDF
jgi:hypothetical protein